MNQIVSLFMFSCGDYEKVKQDVWEENWKAMRLYSVVALVAFGVITLVSVFSLSIGKFKWVYLVYTFLPIMSSPKVLILRAFSLNITSQNRAKGVRQSSYPVLNSHKRV